MKRIQLMILLAAAFAVTMQSCSKEESEGCVDSEACNFNPEADVDNGSCTYPIDWYQDLNGDGLGNPYSIITDCNQPAGYTRGLCNPQTFFRDIDGDGLGDPNNTTVACDSVPGYVSNDDDIIDVIPVVKQRATMTYVGATWCGPCGSNGDPTKEHLETTYLDDIIILNCQSGDAISAAGAFGPEFGSAFQNFVSSTGIPHCYFSGANYPMTDYGFSSAPTQHDVKVDNVLASTAKVGIAANLSLSSGVITVKTATKFVSAAGQHYIGVYLLEDGVMENQVMSGGPDAVTAHNNVLRAAADGVIGALGIESIGTSFVADQIVDVAYDITIPTTVVNSANLQVAVVVWEGSAADKISNAIILDVN